MPRSPAIFEKNKFFTKRVVFPVKSKLSAAELWYKSWKSKLFHYRVDKDNWILSLEYYTHINNTVFNPCFNSPSKTRDTGV